MNLASKIVARLKVAGYEWPGGPGNAEIHRTRAGRHQKACGAWIWFLRTKDGTPYRDVGSHWPAKEIAAGPIEVSVEFGSLVLDPVERRS